MAEVLILGARSWIGFRLAEAFGAARPAWRILGTSSAPAAAFPSGAPSSPPLVGAATADDFLALVRDSRPRVVVNLLRGENEQGMDIHGRVAHACAEFGARYVYASSALAMDGYPVATALTEDLPPLSVTPYGQFKGACETLLASGFPGDDWLALRFASIQGWSPWKPSRNEAFLRKLAEGTPVTVDIGILQNRLQDTVFASAVVDIALDASCKGVFHLGTDDSSDELDFLRSVARAFGQDESLVRAGGRRDVNLALSCARFHAATADRWRRTQAQTLAGLLAEPGLRPWLRR